MQARSGGHRRRGDRCRDRVDAPGSTSPVVPARRRAFVMKVELLYFDGCPSYEALLPRLRSLFAEAGVAAEVELHRVETEEDAVAQRFLGSPTLRVDGVDVEPGA